MNTAQLKKFAAEARTILKEGVILRLSALGFKADGSVAEDDRPQKGQGFVLFRGEALPDDGFYERWQSLYDRIQKKGLQEVYEEAAYTWFNRLTAIRIMARNGFISPVLEYVSATTHIPVILSQAREGIFPEMSAAEHEQLMAIIDDGRKSQEQFAILITAYCHANPVINKCFGGVTDYTTLLLPQNIIAEGGFIDLLNNTPFISENDYKSAELIGWLYQFYISEKKDDVYASFKAGKKAEAEDIPAATQIFTPNWIVKYMVQNTLGRIYLDNNPYDTEIKEKMKYLVEPTEPTPEDAIYHYENLEDLRLGDLACGSGHILNEFFDLLYLIYIEEGYSRRSAIENIFLKNLTGIDLDTRAKQLAQFALLVKACQKDISFLDAKVMPNVLDMPSPLDEEFVHETLPQFFLGVNQQMMQECEEAFKLLPQANNLGSIMKFDISDSTRAAIEIRLNEWEVLPREEVPEAILSMMHSFKLILALTEKYSALCMNPPYMGQGNMNYKLTAYLKDFYKEGKTDLCTVFFMMQMNNTAHNGYYSNIIPPSWISLPVFKDLREIIIEKQSIISLLQLSRGVFGADFGSVSAVIQNRKDINASGIYFKLVNRTFQEFNQVHLRLLFEKSLLNHNFKFDFPHYNKNVNEIEHSERGLKIYYPHIKQTMFKQIPDYAISGFWASNALMEAFKISKFDDVSAILSGIRTGDNDLFLRLWFEINNNSIGYHLSDLPKINNSGFKWFPYVKGGDFRKWYGNQELIINWENNGNNILYHTNKNGVSDARIRQSNFNYYGKDFVTWSRIASAELGARYVPEGLLFDCNSPSIFKKRVNIKYLLGILSSKVARPILKIVAPTVTFQIQDIKKIPFIEEKDNQSEIIKVIDDNICISKEDWDAHETSWDFKINELVAINEEKFLDIINDYAEYKGICIDPAAPEPEKLEWRYDMYKMKWETLFHRLKDNEEELNRKFIAIYGLQAELEPFVRTDEITILQQGEIRVIAEPGDDSGYGDTIEFNKDVVIKQLISYAIGCWMGRYRLDKPGLHIAHPDASPEEMCSYEYNGQQFEIDDDGIIPLLPAYASFADNGLNRIVDFLRIAFGPEKLTENINFVEEALGMTIEKFMVKEFWKYHKKMYQNRPIYWLFSSKKGAFQCLTYMHRMNAYTVEQIRSKYLLPHIDWLKNHIAEMESRASQLTTQERKLKDQMQKDLAECIEYHDELHVVADHNITFDLDDGVVKNYALFGNVLAKIK